MSDNHPLTFFALFQQVPCKSLRRAPEILFEFDASIGHQDRVEQLLNEIADERAAHDTPDPTDAPDPDDR